MTDKDILYKAIVKAKNNGWVVDFPLKDIKEILTYNDYITPTIYYWIIFDHDFAKAFFSNIFGHYGWKVQLEQMVLEKEPLKYLEKFL